MRSVLSCAVDHFCDRWLGALQVRSPGPPTARKNCRECPRQSIGPDFQPCSCSVGASCSAPIHCRGIRNLMQLLLRQVANSLRPNFGLSFCPARGKSRGVLDVQGDLVAARRRFEGPISAAFAPCGFRSNKETSPARLLRLLRPPSGIGSPGSNLRRLSRAHVGLLMTIATTL